MTITPLAPTARSGAAPPRPIAASGVAQVLISDIEPHPGNVRRGDLGDLEELAASIRQHGVLQPLLVVEHPSRPGGYRLLAGHRRHAAAQLAGLATVPVVMHPGPVGPDTVIEVMLIENCHRVDLAPMEKADAFGQLRQLGLTQVQIAERTGFAPATVAHYLTLLDLDDGSQDRVRSGELRVTDAVKGVRRARQQARTKAGKAAGDYSWEPDHLTDRHPLAKRARRLCDAREHTMRRRIGDTACGQCWETAIRDDERTVIAATQE